MDLTKACLSHCDAAVACFKDIQTQINGLQSHIELTPALTAQKLFLRRHLPKTCQVFKEDIPEDIKLFMNDAYYGGRTEVFQLGTHNHTSGIDINSSYPRSMKEEIYPDLLTYRELQIRTESELIRAMQDYEGLAEVDIKSPGLKIPLLPYSFDNKLLFPNGNWTATYTFPELRKALSLGYKILKVLQCGIMKRSKDPMFSSYIDRLYPLKENPKYKQIAKLMLNSLYGKFGQKANYDHGWMLIKDTEAYEHIEVNNKNFRVHNNLLYEYIPPSELSEIGFAKKAYPIIAAYVTSYSRIYLYEAMEAIGFDHIYYTDTDSIYANTSKVNAAIRLGKIKIDSDKLGYWDIEHNDIVAQFKGLKFYRLYEDNEWHYTSKGVPKNKMSCYWRHNSAILTRVRKMNSSIRFGTKVNEFYTLLRVNRDKSHKRLFTTNRDSAAFTISKS